MKYFLTKVTYKKTVRKIKYLLNVRSNIFTNIFIKIIQFYNQRFQVILFIFFVQRKFDVIFQHLYKIKCNLKYCCFQFYLYRLLNVNYFKFFRYRINYKFLRIIFNTTYQHIMVQSNRDSHISVCIKFFDCVVQLVWASAL